MRCVYVGGRHVGWLTYKLDVCLVRQLGLEKVIITQCIAECKALPRCCE